jgi:hypothetical protein
MTMWEHFIREHNVTTRGEDTGEVYDELLRLFKLFLDKLGSEGWEMVTVSFETTLSGFRADRAQTHPDYYEGVLNASIVAKRPLEGQPYR